ncbi:RNA 2',3'-cyclic phosphodiesterase [bacterium]|nr:RNA 2',3'-cyclic phosphodiesterase [bacterium]
MPKIRTFIAVEIPDETKDRIAQVQSELKKYGERISWVKSGNIHLTLKFLGDVEEGQIKALGRGMESAAKKAAPFTLAFRNLGVFPNLRRARVVWVGANESSGILIKLADSLDSEMSLLGFPKESRKFSPHLTIGRIKARPAEKFLKRIEHYEFEGGEALINNVCLMKSDLRPTGAIYTALKQIHLVSSSRLWGVNS